MFIGLLLLLFVNFTSFQIHWFQLTIEVFLLQSLLLYYLYRLVLVINLYQLVGYSTLTLLFLAAYLFWLQFDVFACFLLVAESVVMLFVLSLLMHLNYTNLSKLNTPKLFFLLPLFVLMFHSTNSTEVFSYWVDWYSTQVSQYSDLLPQYIYFYVIDSPMVILTGFWLLILTFLLVHLILSISFSRHTNNLNIIYTRKTQNIWSQWYKKPNLRFFKK